MPGRSEVLPRFEGGIGVSGQQRETGVQPDHLGVADVGGVETRWGGADPRRPGDDGDQVRRLVDGVGELARDDRVLVHPFDRRVAEHSPLGPRRQFDLTRRERRGFLGQFLIAEVVFAVPHEAVGGQALVFGDLPASSGGLDQQVANGRRGRADRLVDALHRVGVGGDLCAIGVRVALRLLDREALDGHLQLLGDHHGDGGAHTLSRVRNRDRDRDPAGFGVDAHERVHDSAFVRATAFLIALRILGYVPHRQTLSRNASSMSSSVGSGCLASNAMVAMIWPGWQ